MKRFRLVMIPLALAAAAGSAGAQRWGGSPAPAGRHASNVEPRQTTGVTWNGTVSKWGGSPVRDTDARRLRPVHVIPLDAYFPFAVDAPAPVTYMVDTVYTVYTAVPANAVEMKVVTSSRPEPELTAMDVYRQQRFRNP